MTATKLALWAREHLVLISLVVFIVLPAFSFVMGSAVILAYIFWPTDYYRITMPSITHNAENIVLLTHGLNDTPASWSTSLKQSFEQQLSRRSESFQVIALDWNPYSANALRCSVDGKRIGALLGREIAASAQLRSAHLIGHSCGSFVILGFCEALKAVNSNIRVQSTYLAPVNIYGGMFWNYGNSHFGSCADFSETYFDREDTVGDGRQAPSNTHGFDITAARKSRENMISPHVWPTVYYQLVVKSGAYLDLRSEPLLSRTYAPGILEQINDPPTSSIR